MGYRSEVNVSEELVLESDPEDKEDESPCNLPVIVMGLPHVFLLWRLASRCVLNHLHWRRTFCGKTCIAQSAYLRLSSSVTRLGNQLLRLS